MKKTLRFYLNYSLKTKSLLFLSIFNIVIILGMFIFIFKNSAQGISSVFQYDYAWSWIVVCVSCVMFLAIQNIKIFKQSQKDGTILILLTKNIGRLKISISQIIVVFINVLIWSLIAYISIIIAALVIPSRVNSEAPSLGYNIKLATSIFLGFIIFGILISCILMLLCHFMRSLYAFGTTFLLWTLAPVANMVLIQNQADIKHRFDSGMSFQLINKNNQIKKYELDWYTNRDKGVSESWSDPTHYDKLKYIDIWGQLKSIMHVGFDIKDINQTDYLYGKWIRSAKPILEEIISFKINKKNYYYIPRLHLNKMDIQRVNDKTKHYQEKMQKYFEKAKNSLLNSKANMNIISLQYILMDFAKAINLPDLVNKLEFTEDKDSRGFWKIKYDSKKQINENIKGISEDFYKLESYKFLVNNNNDNLIKEIIAGTRNKNDVNNNAKLIDRDEINANQIGEMLIETKTELYSNEIYLLIAWLVIIFSLSTLSVTLFIKKDIK